MIPGINRDTIHVDYGGFWKGRVNQRIFCLSAAAPPEKPKGEYSP